MTSEYMRRLMETVEPSTKEEVDEGILDSIEDYFVNKGLEWKGKYSQRALGQLDTRRLAKTVYDTLQYHFGRTDTPQTMESVLKFFTEIFPALDEKDVYEVLQKAGVKFDPKQQTNEQFAFIKSLTEAQTLSDRELKKVATAFIRYIEKQGFEPKDFIEPLFKVAPPREKRDLKQNIAQASQEVVQNVKQDKNKEEPAKKPNEKPVEEPVKEPEKKAEKGQIDEPEEIEREKPEEKEPEQEKQRKKPGYAYFSKTFDVSEDALKGMRLAGRLGYIQPKENDVEYKNEEFIKDVVGMKGNKLQGAKLTTDQLRQLQDFLEEFSNNPKKVKRIARQILQHYPKVFD